MLALVGHTGFVGQNLLASGSFDALYNSKNIRDAFGTKPDVLFFCGIGAQKFMANHNPSADKGVVEEALDNIKKIQPRRLILISTVDVYPVPRNVDEDTPICADELHPYGKNRLWLEMQVHRLFEDVLIVRLPGLYGKGMKKNFIFDLVSVIPAMIRDEKMQRLDVAFLKRFYIGAEKGFYTLVKSLSQQDKNSLKEYFTEKGFTAPTFTDSRSVFQFYNLKYLFGHIQTASDRGIKVLNVTTAPLCAADIFRLCRSGKEFSNYLHGEVPVYDVRSKWAQEITGSNDYFFDAAFVLEDIGRFVKMFEGGQTL